MTELRDGVHSVTGGRIVEVWEDGEMIAAIYPMERGVKVVSKHLENRWDLAVIDLMEPPAVLLHIWRGRGSG